MSMAGGREIHSSVAGSPIEHSLTPILSRLVDAHLRRVTGQTFISRTSRLETTRIHDLLGRVLLDRMDDQAEIFTPEAISLIDQVTEDIEDGYMEKIEDMNPLHIRGYLRGIQDAQ